ncbi:tetratricopeptide repeat protein [Candidatus Calescamantes bacterium]|nr:tetratricopeptide repeat protein [Candidatus Calescamantes bacterium]
MRKNYLLLLFLIASLPYLNTLHNDFVYDDKELILKNKVVKEGRLKDIFLTPFWGKEELGLWRPITLLSFRWNYLLGDFSPVSFHLLNIFLHSLTSILVFLFFFKITKDEIISIFSAVIFSLHPVHVEAVSWIVGRSEVLSTLFLLLSFYLLLLKNNLSSLLLPPVFFFLSLLSKETGVVLPLLIIAYYFLFPKRISRKKFLIQLLLFTITFEIYLHLRIKILKGLIGPAGEKEYFYGYPPLTRLLTFPLIFFHYLKLAFFPFRLSVDYTFPPITCITHVFLVLTLLFLLYLAVIFFTFKKKPLISFSLLFFLLSLFPYLHIIPIGWLIGERFLYLPSIGICVLLGILFKEFFNRKGKISLIFLSLLLISFSIRIIVRNRAWQNEEILWKTTARDNPHSIRAWYNLGTSVLKKGNLKESLLYLKKAISLIPSQKRKKFADIYHNLGIVYAKMGKTEEAEEMFKTSLKYNPYLPSTYNNLGNLYFKKGKMKEAIKCYRKSLKLDPHNPVVLKNIARAYLRLSETGKCKEYASKTLSIPSLTLQQRVEILNILAIAEREEGNLSRSYDYLAQALRIDRNNYLTYYNLAVFLEKDGKRKEAIENYLRALNFGGPPSLILKTLGRLYLEEGELEKSEKFFKEALKLNPKDWRIKEWLRKIKERKHNRGIS